MTTLITILAAILVFGAIIFFHELGHFTAAKLSGVTVTEFAVGMGPLLLKKEYKGTVYSLRLLPVGGFTALEGEDEAVDSEHSLTNKPLLSRVSVFLAGSVFNIVMGYLILVVLTVMSGYVGTTYIAAFREGSISQSTLALGDKILKVNGHRVTTSNDITYEFLRDPDGLIDMTVQRGDETLTLPVRFRMEEISEGVNAIDIDFQVAAVPATPRDYVTYPINWGSSIVKQVWGALIDLVTGRFAVNQLSGPVGVVSAIGQASKLGLESLMLMAAMIAINIGIFNLLPLPILDGGKIIITVIEAAIGRPINARLIEGIMVGSVILIVGLMVYVTYNDIFRLFVK